MLIYMTFIINYTHFLYSKVLKRNAIFTELLDSEEAVEA